jgi:hypothetical protein
MAGRPYLWRPTPELPALGLLAAVLGGSPRLVGAACRDHADLFAATVRRRDQSVHSLAANRAAAREICGTCPALDACRDWVRGLPLPRRPAGIVAGHLATHPAMKHAAPQHNPEGRP